MESGQRPTLGLIGAGRVGGALTRALYARGYPVAAVCSRTLAHASELAQAVGAALVEAPQAMAARVDLLLLAVPDDSIGPLTATLARAAGWRQGAAAVHLSGTHGQEILAPLSAAGVLTGALHPLQTFADSRAPLLPGTTFAIDAPSPLHATLHQLVTALDGRALDLQPGDRPLYHAAAVMCANYAVTLMAQAVGLLQQCGLSGPQALQALLPLLHGTVEGLERSGLPAALTGPIVRGDVGTVRRHLAALEQRAPAAGQIYRALGQATLPLAARRGLASDLGEQLSSLLSYPGEQ